MHLELTCQARPLVWPWSWPSWQWQTCNWASRPGTSPCMTTTVSKAVQHLDHILHLLPLQPHLETTRRVVAWAGRRWGRELQAWPDRNRWLSLGLRSECPFPFQTDKSPPVFPTISPFFKVMGRAGFGRTAAFQLRVSANSLLPRLDRADGILGNGGDWEWILG